MLDVRGNLFEQLSEVVVVQLVADLAAAALACHEPEMTKQAKLMRHAELHVDTRRDLIYSRRSRVQASEDPMSECSRRCAMTALL